MVNIEDELSVSGERLTTIIKELNLEDTMSEIVDAQGKPVDSTPQPTAPAQPEPQVEEEVTIETEQPGEVETKALPEMSCAYVVGLKPDGSFVFEVLGDAPGLVQLLGLHKYAEHRLEVAKDINQGYGPPLLNQRLEQIQQMLKAMLNMMTQQSKDSLLAKMQ